MAGRHGSGYWLTCFWFVILLCAVAVAVLKPAAAVQPAWPAETTESFSPVYVLQHSYIGILAWYISVSS